MRPLVLLLALVLLAGAACGGDGRQDTTQRQAQAADTRGCTNEQAGYSIEYPADWHTNSGDPPTCSFFDPDPVEVPERPGTSRA